MNVDALRSAALDRVRERAGELGLDADRVELAYVLNAGGFVNASFRVSDGHTRYHLKLGVEPDAREDLGRWRDLGAALEPYHAPPIVAWVDVGVAEGPLTPWIDGVAPARVTLELAERVLPVVARLHGDVALAARLATGDGDDTCADVYLDTYGERLVEDLALVEADRPPFVGDAALRLMRDEATRLAALVRGSAAFREPARSPIHADLWANNLLVERSGAWHLLDWDDLRLGDPAMDVAMLLGPSPSDVEPRDDADLVARALSGDAARERFDLYTRAVLLDWAVDSLADYVEADAAPEHAEAVRADKRRVHEAALARYASRYLG